VNIKILSGIARIILGGQFSGFLGHIKAFMLIIKYLIPSILIFTQHPAAAVNITAATITSPRI